MLREWLFDAVSRQFIADVPADWRFGPAELDGRSHAILRADLDKDTADKLRKRQLRLKSLGGHIAGNYYASAAFEAAPENEQVYPRTFTNLRSGKRDTDEESAWANAREGDVIHVSKAPDRENAPGYAFQVKSLKDRKALVLDRSTRKEAEAWQAS